MDGLRSGIEVPYCGRRKSHEGEPSMEKFTTIRLDIAKQVFQVMASMPAAQSGKRATASIVRQAIHQVMRTSPFLD